ncbi:AGC protein kinase [Gaeumannomyces tritici R3-111a-1]|uniref:non-specific serine/threonine protein kinase n=1 Tax=Gaeumannomyces tritici (strain R3-111a-1) TaxID=644352 RepID=J3NIX9_GAET3|nr:AGC protein kinase [Gaeumannomyces tritici R3-111a-1]EJT81229.1 AGC protein kinase [Gaeumannomyces tritici R3-111a-1]
MDQESTSFPAFNPPAPPTGGYDDARRPEGQGEQDGGLRTPNTLAPPAVSSLRFNSDGVMQRSLSEDIREEREELREAAEQTLNVIMDLNLDGTIRWVSPSWVDVIGTPPDTVPGTSVSDLIVSENKTIFTDIVESMKKDDSRSQFLRFAMKPGPLSVLLTVEAVTGHDQGLEPSIELEAQGIMVFDATSGGESHMMWMIRPWIGPREIKIDLPDVIVESLGSGAEILASYLTQLAESGMEDPANQPPPLPVLCRICERQIPPWWFEKHTDLCLQEHRAELDVQMAQESLTEHRHSIVRVLDALEVRKSRSTTGDQSPLPLTEYKGLPIGPPPSTSSSSGASSPVPGSNRSRDRSGGFGHARARSFAVRRPQARIVELILDLCDTALEISTPAIKEASSQNPGEFRTQSPQSESRISQVIQWQSPSNNTMEQEQGIALLCSDTETVVKAKVEAVLRHRRIIEYAERIRVEFTVTVEACVEEAMRKAAKIAAGRLSDSTEDEEEEEVVEVEEEQEVEQEDEEVLRPAEDAAFPESFDTPSSLAMALRNANISDDPDGRRLSNAITSTRSSSPRECPTPRSHRGNLSVSGQTRESRRGSMLFESDAGDSDGSIRSSSVTSRHPPRTDSPISEFGDLRRQASSRQHQRRSLILPGASSPRRQESPSRSTQPSSPLRIHKPRGPPFPSDALMSPESSPMLPRSEFTSPAVPMHHHRRQSSAAMSLDAAGFGSLSGGSKPPPSPRLHGANAPPLARAVPPSIKDFEVIKPISKGAFGSVYLSKKKSTGEYFAIKVLKKADMVAKNQVTNVKAERAIMMWQGESDFVAKLYWTFSSKDYLYLVMEYLNGGDCASLIKILGGLPEDWVKKYLGEVILGVEHLHSRGIVHRDLKPDNLLIDQKGHLKLTDFGLSRMGLIGRQKRALNSGSTDPAPDLLKQGPFARSASITSSRSTSLDLHAPTHSPGSTPQINPNEPVLGPPSYFSLGSSAAAHESRRTSGRRSDSGGSDALTHMLGNFSLNDTHASVPPQAVQSPRTEGSEGEAHGSPDFASLHHTTTHGSTGTDPGKGTPPMSSMPPPNWTLFDPEDKNRRFVGTPDYLAPETIKGEPQDETSDWWSVGCIMFEFLYGMPPFHAPEPELVFENILARRIQWPDEIEDEVSGDAKDILNKLLCMDPRERLGSNRDEKFVSGGEEIRNHAWFQGMGWDTLLQDEAQFVPQPENPEDTEYFDSRGATLQSFAEEMEDQASPPSVPATEYPDRPHDALSRVRSQFNSIKRGLMPLHIPPHVRDHKSRRLSEPVATDDFGSFTFKNLPVLDKANKDVIQKLRAEALAAHKPTAISPGGMNSVTSPGGLEAALSIPVHRTMSNAKASQRPQSPSGLSHANSSPSRASQPSSPLLVSFVAGQGSEGRRKASSNSSSLSQPASSNLQPGSFFDVPRVPPSLQKAATTVAAVSPVKGRAPPSPLPLSPAKVVTTPGRQGGGSSVSRSRSLTVGSQEGSPVASDMLAHHRNRRSQVFDMSPSSSDNEGEKVNALLRVQRRRQSSRRLSQITLDGPVSRPLDVLICEDHPVSRMIMEKLLEKLRCRTISATNGSEAVRYSMSDIKFDIIFMEFRMPQISGADVARMIRETKNANSHTPIVAITAYLKELQAPHYFDSLIDKPISSSKLTEVLGNLCQWKPPAGNQPHSLSLPLAHPTPSGLRQESLRLEDSPTSGSSIYAHRTGSSFRGSSREDSISSSLFGDSESVTTDDIAVGMSRKTTGDWEDTGLGITQQEQPPLSSPEPTNPPIQLVVQETSPVKPAKTDQARANAGTIGPVKQLSLEKLRAKRDACEKRRSEGSVDSADDEDDELGLGRLPVPNNGNGSQSGGGQGRQHFRSKSILPSSKLGIEMMRANSHDSVVHAGTPEKSAKRSDGLPDTHMEQDYDEEGDTTVIHTPPDQCGGSSEDNATVVGYDETPRPTTQQGSGTISNEPTPRPPVKAPPRREEPTTFF